MESAIKAYAIILGRQTSEQTIMIEPGWIPQQEKHVKGHGGTRCGRPNSGLQRCPVLIPRTYDYVIWHGKVDFAHVIKIKILLWERLPWIIQVSPM